MSADDIDDFLDSIVTPGPSRPRPQPRPQQSKEVIITFAPRGEPKFDLIMNEDDTDADVRQSLAILGFKLLSILPVDIAFPEKSEHQLGERTFNSEFVLPRRSNAFRVDRQLILRNYQQRLDQLAATMDNIRRKMSETPEAGFSVEVHVPPAVREFQQAYESDDIDRFAKSLVWAVPADVRRQYLTYATQDGRVDILRVLLTKNGDLYTVEDLKNALTEADESTRHVLDRALARRLDGQTGLYNWKAFADLRFHVPDTRGTIGLLIAVLDAAYNNGILTRWGESGTDYAIMDVYNYIDPKRANPTNMKYVIEAMNEWLENIHDEISEDEYQTLYDRINQNAPIVSGQRG